MAKQKGLMKYQGTIGDIRHFRIKGKSGYFAGLTGGPTANQIKNAPEFARTRENMSEFGGSAKAAKSLRVILGPSLGRYSDSSLTGRLTAFMKGINLRDTTGARGKRAIKISTHKNLLTGVNINKNLSFNSVFNVPIRVDLNIEGSQVVVFDGFLAQDYVKAPSLATHFKLMVVTGWLSDFEFDEGTKSYEPVMPLLNEMNEIVYSEFLPVTGEVQKTEIIVGDEIANISSDSAVKLTACGIEFYHKFKDEYLPVSGSACMKIFDLV